MLPESEWQRQPSPALISVDEWDEANRILAKMSRKVPRPSRVRYPFAGLVHCSCGGRLYRENNKGKAHVVTPYRCNTKGCSNTILTAELEQIVLDNIESFYCSEESPRGAQLADLL